jgi:hypothetical protein
MWGIFVQILLWALGIIAFAGSFLAEDPMVKMEIRLIAYTSLVGSIVLGGVVTMVGV